MRLDDAPGLQTPDGTCKGAFFVTTTAATQAPSLTASTVGRLVSHDECIAVGYCC